MVMYASPQTKIIEMLKTCRLPLEQNTDAGEKLLILTDTDMDPLIWETIAAAAKDVGFDTTVLLMTPLPYPAAEPPTFVAEAMRKANLCITATSKEFHQNKARRDAQAGGTHFLIMEQVSVDMLTSPITKTDHAAMGQAGQEISQILSRSQNCHIVSDTGSDLRVTIGPGQHTWVECGKVTSPNVYHEVGQKTSGGMICFPGGESGVFPVRGTAQGKLAWDTSAHHPPGLFKEPVILYVKGGRVTELEGGTEARQLRIFLEKYGDENSWIFPVEITIGMNPGATFTGVLRTDKKVYGKIHTAMGPGSLFTDITSKLHIDGITAKPTITVDGRTIVDKGKIKIPPLDQWSRS